MFQVDREPSGVWGVRPSKGSWWDPNATFDGITGRLVAGDYDLTYGPAWLRTLERNSWFDFTPGVTTHRVTLAYNFKEPAVDFTLLLRPFTLSAWIGVAVCVAAMSMAVIFFKARSAALKDAVSARTAVASGWILFILVNAFYGGALTMFFSSAASLPFGTLEEGAEKYPTWKFLHLYGSDLVLLGYQRSDGGIGLPGLLERVLDHPDRWVVRDEREGLRRMSREVGTFMFTSEYPLMEAWNHGDFEGLELKLFGETEISHTQYMLARNSPYRLILSEGSRKLVEAGVFETVMGRWRGRLSEASQNGLKVLGGRHMALGFMVFLVIYAGCLVLLLLECLAKRTRYFGPSEKRAEQNSISFQEYVQHDV